MNDSIEARIAEDSIILRTTTDDDTFSYVLRAEFYSKGNNVNGNIMIVKYVLGPRYDYSKKANVPVAIDEQWKMHEKATLMSDGVISRVYRQTLLKKIVTKEVKTAKTHDPIDISVISYLSTLFNRFEQELKNKF